MRILFTLAIVACLCAPVTAAAANTPKVSDDTQFCLDCHTTIHPGIVEGWRGSRHAAQTPAAAMKAIALERKVSSTDIPKNLQDVPVGCAECHTLRPGEHADTFEHNGYQVHVVVSPEDCAVCHATENDQFKDNIMSRAYGNLSDNPLYLSLIRAINGTPSLSEEGIMTQAPDKLTNEEACYYCHGTDLKVTGTQSRDTILGEMDFPVISGWPNAGVGRVNLDGSLGNCAACHSRHEFSIEMARKPYTCEECHNGPDVPAYKVYAASKHGNIYAAEGSSWNFTAVPWVLGKDILAPTCATCHMSLLTNTEGEVVSQRSHTVNDRLPWRIFGLIYAHPQPKNPSTSNIVNAQGLNFPTGLDGSLASEFLITPSEMATRQQAMQASCLACHDPSWVDGHWGRFENTINATDATIKTATEIMQAGWEKGLAKGMSDGGGMFDEYPERVWSNTWLFYANNVRFASAMAGGGDYGVFADGRYQLTMSVQQLFSWLKAGEAYANAKTEAKSK